MKPEYDQEGKIVVPAGYILFPERERVRNGRSEIIPAHLRKLPGPRKHQLARKIGKLFGITVVDEEPNKTIARAVILSVQKEINETLDKMLISL